MFFDLVLGLKNLFLKIPRITSLDDISADTVQELLIYLKEKGYQQRNIQAEFGARILHNPSEIRENLSNLSTPSL